MNRLRQAAGWALLPTLMLMQLFDLRRGLVGQGWLWSALLVGFGAVVLFGGPLAWSRRHDLPRMCWLAAALFTVVIAHACLSALVSGDSIVLGRTNTFIDPPGVRMPAPLEYRLVPLVTAWLAMAAAMVLVMLVPRDRLLSRVWWSGWLLVVSSLLLWPRAVQVHGTPRLATGMGGSATLHLVFLLCTGLFLGAAAQRYHTRWSVAGAVSAIFCLLMTGSRSGLLSLAVLGLLVVAWTAGRVAPRLLVGVLAAAVLVVGVVLTLAPAARRLLSFSDSWRLDNAATAWSLVSGDPVRLLYGFGSGRLWPWYAFEARFFWLPWGSHLEHRVGRLLTNPHSVPLGVLIELGVLALVVVAALCLLPALWLARRWRHRDGLGSAPHGIALALVAGLVTFFFDYYLFKNFAVSFWWWVMVCALTVLPEHDSRGITAVAGEMSPPTEVSATSPGR